MPYVGLIKLDNEPSVFIKEGNFLKTSFKVSELTCFSQAVC
jgi:hypothetical protein